MRYAAALILFLLISIYAGFFAGDTGYFIADQIGDIILVALVAVLLPKGLAKAIAYGIVLVHSFELIDELMGNNLRLFYNDIVGYGLALILTIYLHRKWNTSKKSS